MVGATLLHEGEDGVQHDDAEDGHAELRQAGEDGEPARHPEHQREEVDQLVGEAQDAGPAARRRQLVRPVTGQPSAGLLLGEPE